MYALLLVLILSLACGTVISQRVACSRRYFTSSLESSFVCVCNSTYCDTIESVDNTLDKTVYYQEYITSRINYRLDKFVSTFSTQGWKSLGLLNLKINRAKSYQKTTGFGGSMTDSTGFVAYQLSDCARSNLIKSYFDSTGLEYNFIRVPVAGSDFSNRTYTYNDSPDDFNLTNFSLAYEDYNLKIPLIQSAIRTSKKQLKLVASAWTAPPWMKTNKKYTGLGSLEGPVGGVYYQTWANYYLKFFQAYKQFNLSFWGVTGHNEPTNGNIPNSLFVKFNSMGFTPETQAAFIFENLGPTLEANGLGDVKIMILDDQRAYLPLWPKKVYQYSPDLFNKYVSGIAVHWYLDQYIPPLVLDLTNTAFPDKFLLATEACNGYFGLRRGVVLGDWNRAEKYAKDIIEDLSHYVTGWIDWNLALDLQGGPNWANNFVDSPVIVNQTGDEFFKQPMFYALGHFSKFIAENSVRIDVSNKIFVNPIGVSYVAFEDLATNQTTLVIMNEGLFDLNYSIYDPDIDKYINSVIQARSIKTIVWFH